jgi:hypothetical protein
MKNLNATEFVIYVVIGIVALFLAWAVISGVVYSVTHPAPEPADCGTAYHRIGEC